MRGRREQGRNQRLGNTGSPGPTTYREAASFVRCWDAAPQVQDQNCGAARVPAAEVNPVQQSQPEAATDTSTSYSLFGGRPGLDPFNDARQLLQLRSLNRTEPLHLSPRFWEETTATHELPSPVEFAKATESTFSPHKTPEHAIKALGISNFGEHSNPELQTYFKRPQLADLPPGIGGHSFGSFCFPHDEASMDSQLVWGQLLQQDSCEDQDQGTEQQQRLRELKEQLARAQQRECAGRAEVNHLREMFKQQAEAADAALVSTSQLQQRLEQLQAQKAAVDSAYVAVHAQLQQMENQLRDKAQVEAQLAATEQRLNTMQREHAAQLHSTRAAHGKEKTQLTHDVASLKKQLSSGDAELQTVRGEVARLKGEKKKLEQELTELNSQGSHEQLLEFQRSLQSSQLQLKAQQSQAQQQLNTLQAELTAQKGATQALHREKAELSNTVAKLTTRNITLEAEACKASADAEILRKRMLQAEEQAAAVGQELKETKQALKASRHAAVLSAVRQKDLEAKVSQAAEELNQAVEAMLQQQHKSEREATESIEVAKVMTYVHKQLDTQVKKIMAEKAAVEERLRAQALSNRLSMQNLTTELHGLCHDVYSAGGTVVERVMKVRQARGGGPLPMWRDIESQVPLDRSLDHPRRTVAHRVRQALASPLRSSNPQTKAAPAVSTTESVQVRPAAEGGRRGKGLFQHLFFFLVFCCIGSASAAHAHQNKPSTS